MKSPACQNRSRALCFRIQITLANNNRTAFTTLASTDVWSIATTQSLLKPITEKASYKQKNSTEISLEKSAYLK